ncbi:MAG: acetate kinase, partial [Candidatus Latescibacterota bacterium]
NGSLDPFIIPFMMDRENLSTQDIRHILSTNGGLLGISGISGDVRDLEMAIEQGHDRARLALDAFCYGIKKEIGAFTAAMGGLDAIAFAGGIGERGAGVRKRICEGLGFLGVDIDPSLNENAPEEGLISRPASSVKILIIKTDEERIVAQATVEYLKNQ